MAAAVAVAVGHSAPSHAIVAFETQIIVIIFETRPRRRIIVFVFIFALATAALSARSPVAPGRRQRGSRRTCVAYT